MKMTTEQASAEAVERALASRAAMARMMAVAGHDLKQPLHVAMMSLAYAAEAGMPALIADRLRIALDAMKRLGSELDDIARLSQKDETLQPRRQNVLLAQVLERVESDWRFYAEACGVELRIISSDSIVETDPEMLHTILRNLVGNAIKYSGPRGHVRLVCRTRRHRACIDVQDDGAGIPAARLERIFDAFERGDSAEWDGMGLGLMIVRQTADLLRHQVAVRSIQNVGSTFSVELPLANSVERILRGRPSPSGTERMTLRRNFRASRRSR
ncbi:HAMP domain-containing histidine kinase [Mesorhizobium sp. BR1-1-3]|uniref:sensor histidine kinase n=1 Tax=Mesorhizobium sp. BR1-1-3 TaxID=2876651 RepID=UPI001CD10078|nr:HAMP domain-containing sensor histidine kinase [Mesorhizobium sp. BR1-1-3]MBZ9891493.1 HAMP domain-containing histidine kinase [Mesorhizobium sp. BR1-1-3]